MTHPPCYNDGKGCPNRGTYCRKTCEAWAAWETVHRAEREAIRRKKAAENDANGFLIGQGKRTRKKSQAQYQQKYRRRGK